MKHAITTFCAVLALSFSCCKNESRPDTSFDALQRTAWILGEWDSSSDQGVFSENWTKQSDSVMEARSSFIKDADTLFTETIQMVQRGQDVFYIAATPAQNEGKGIAFKLVSSSDTQLVFENPEHDFPQRIVYKRIGTDSLVAEVSGPRQGQTHTEVFAMKRK